MKRLVTITTMVVVGLSIGCGAGPETTDRSAQATVPGAAVTAHGGTELAWEDDWDTAFAKARSQDKVVLASFEAEWCVWCRRLETTTYRDTKVASVLDASVVPVSLDVDGNGRELSDTYAVDGLPTVVVFDSEGRELGRIDGYMPPGSFLERLEAILAQRG